MTLGRIIWNNARQRALSTALTSLSVAVGVALIIAILTIKLVSQERLRLGYTAFDLVVGAKGSPLQLVLNVVYHLDVSPGNAPYAVYEKLAKDPRVKAAAPLSVGDNYRGFRMVGTSDSFLKMFEPQPGHVFELATGRIFHFAEADLRNAMRGAMQPGAGEGTAESDRRPSRTGKGGAAIAKGRKRDDAMGSQEEGSRPARSSAAGLTAAAGGDKPLPYTAPTVDSPAGHCEAVLGSVAAEETGLRTGDKFVATHGLQTDAEGRQHDHSPWTVVGILKPTGTPADRVIYINLDSFYRIEGHVIERREDDAGGGEARARTEPEAGEISAVVVRARDPMAVWALRKELNARADIQAAVPADEIRKLLAIVGNVDRILLTQAILIVLVSAVGAGLAMFNSMNERRRDIAVMRALGARRGTIMGILVGEAVLIAAVGGLAGLILGHVIIHAAAPAVKLAVGFAVPAWTLRGFEPVVLLGVLMVGCVAGIGPAIAGYRTDVAPGLAPNT